MMIRGGDDDEESDDHGDDDQDDETEREAPLAFQFQHRSCLPQLQTLSPISES